MCIHHIQSSALHAVKLHGKENIQAKMLRVSCFLVKPTKISVQSININFLHLRKCKFPARTFVSCHSCFVLNNGTSDKSDPTFVQRCCNPPTRKSSSINKTEADFFGILDDCHKSCHNDVNKVNKHRPTTPSPCAKIDAESLKKKYTFIQKNKEAQIGKKEMHVATPYGMVRLDDQGLKEKDALHQIKSRISVAKVVGDEKTVKENGPGMTDETANSSASEIIKDSSIPTVPNTHINTKYLAELENSCENEELNTGTYNFHENKTISMENIDLKSENDEHNVFDEQYFHDSIITQVGKNKAKTVPPLSTDTIETEATYNTENINFELNQMPPQKYDDVKVTYNEFDQQYFNEKLSSVSGEYIKTEIKAEKRTSSDHLLQPSNYFDEVYFTDVSPTKSEFNFEDTDERNKDSKQEYSSNHKSVSSNKEMLIDFTGFNREYEMKPNNLGQLIPNQKKRLRNRVKPNIDEPQTAYDYAMKVRKELKTKQDQKQQEKKPEIKPCNTLNIFSFEEINLQLKRNNLNM